MKFSEREAMLALVVTAIVEVIWLVKLFRDEPQEPVRLPVVSLWPWVKRMSEIVFEVREGKNDGVYTALAVSGGIHT